MRSDLLIGTAWALVFWFFIAVKVSGTTFAAWSWLWVLMPIVPTLSLLVHYWGL